MLAYKFPNSASLKIAVTGTAARLLDLINTAAGQTLGFPYDLNLVEITPEDGDIRLTENAVVPTADNGTLFQQNETRQIECAPVDVRLISVAGGTVNCNVRLGWKRGNSVS